MRYSDKYTIDVVSNFTVITSIIHAISDFKEPDDEDILKILQKNPDINGKILSKSQILYSYNNLKKSGQLKLSTEKEKTFLRSIKKKKTRTISGVTPVTVLTKPFPCPGKCIYCPNDVLMPKSYMVDEPGAQRALANKFDPYYQTFNRLTAIKNMGHPTDKIELIILGGTWTSYPEFYQIWFVKRCFDAMNEFQNSKTTDMLSPDKELPFDESFLKEIKGALLGDTTGKNNNSSSQDSYNKIISKALSTKLAESLKESATWQELFKTHKQNENSKTRCIGLVIETRPDEIDEEEIIRIRKLGATKVQIGIQSLNDIVLKLNKRGHDSNQTRIALNLLRQAGFKIHTHWMPNLYGSTVQKDINDFKKMFDDDSIKPDELKVYPCSLIASAELMSYYNKGLWKPYSEEEVRKVLTQVFINVPRYCRITRVIRDIPGTEIVMGNRKTNLRETIETELLNLGIKSKDIRSREIRNADVSAAGLSIKITKYATKVSTEVFLEYITKDDHIAGFLRLSLPKKSSFIDELKKSSIIREIHIYGESLGLGIQKKGKAQHIGLGRGLIAKAEEISSQKGFEKIAVISSIGTRKYYEHNGFSKADGKKFLYQTKLLSH